MTDLSTAFRVAVKESATEANEAVARFAAADEIVEFDSEMAARSRAGELSADGSTPVAVQHAAPQDAADVDAYLVAWPRRRKWDPDGSPTTGLTFGTTANQYGALGEALVCSPTVNPPLLTHFAELDTAESSDAALRVELDTNPDPVVVGTTGERWEPDCRATVRLGPDRPVLTEYWCEVKAGDGSFERSQREAMRAKAREATVLKIRVDLDDLPDGYTAWIRKVEPDEGDGETESRAYRVNATLDSFD